MCAGRTEKLALQYDIDIQITHFPLHPDTPEAGLTLEELFAGKNFDVPTAMKRMAGLLEQEGLPCGDRTMTYNSRLAQELATWAAGSGEPGIHGALFRAYFVDSTNIARVEELVRIAEQVGLSGAEAKQVLEARRFRGAVDANWRRSHELGITGIPTFVLADRMVSGAQTYDALEAWVGEAGAVKRDGKTAKE